jgi:hypothetical protein
MAADSRTGSKQDAQGEIEPRKRGPSGRHYTETEIETGVFALAMASGSPPRASEAIALQFKRLSSHPKARRKAKRGDRRVFGQSTPPSTSLQGFEMIAAVGSCEEMC